MRRGMKSAIAPGGESGMAAPFGDMMLMVSRRQARPAMMLTLVARLLDETVVSFRWTWRRPVEVEYRLVLIDVRRLAGSCPRRPPFVDNLAEGATLSQGASPRFRAGNFLFFGSKNK